MTCSDIAKVIVSGKETTNSFTVPEGSTIETVAETLAKDGLVDKKKFLELRRIPTPTVILVS